MLVLKRSSIEARGVSSGTNAVSGSGAAVGSGN